MSEHFSTQRTEQWKKQLQGNFDLIEENFRKIQTQISEIGKKIVNSENKSEKISELLNELQTLQNENKNSILNFDRLIIQFNEKFNSLNLSSQKFESQQNVLSQNLDSLKLLLSNSEKNIQQSIFQFEEKMHNFSIKSKFFIFYIFYIFILKFFFFFKSRQRT